MENEFLAYSVEDESCSCYRFLGECFPVSGELCKQFLCCACCFSYCCCLEESAISLGSADGRGEKKSPAHFPRVEYKPLIDSNILTGNTLLHTSGGEYYFPQTKQTLWPEHGARYQPIKSCPVVSEQPHSLGNTHLRRSTRIITAIKAHKRSQLRSFRSPKKQKYDPTSPLPSLANSSIEDPDQPTLTFATMHDIQTSTFTIFLKFASNLNQLLDKPHKQSTHSSISLYLLPSKNEIHQTHSDLSVASNNPVYNERFVFSGVPISDLFEQTLVFQVYDGRALIGTTKILLSSADLLGYTVCKHIDRVTEYTDCDSRHSAGDIQIALTYYPDTEVIEGSVLRVTNLRQHILTVHPPRPYINIYLTHEGKRYAKWKSSVHYDTTVEVFNEVFQFNISKMDVNLIMLCIHIKEYHRTHFNNLLGIVEIGSNAGATGITHWLEVVNSPRQKVSHWHTVVPVERTHVHPAATTADLASVKSTT